MREILFKARIINGSKWVYGYLFNGFSERYYIREQISSDGSCDWIIDPSTLCEFTGLYDVDGNKIFENDLVDEGYYKGEKWIGGLKAYVEFCTTDIGSCGCCFPRFVGSGFKADNLDLEHCKIIGNKYDTLPQKNDPFSYKKNTTEKEMEE